IWNGKVGRQVGAFTQSLGRGTCLAFSPDGRKLACGTGESGLALADTVTTLSRSVATEAKVLALTFAPDGSHLIAGHADGLITTWKVASGELVRSLPGHASAVFGLAISPDGRTLASAGEDRTVRVWDAATGQELLRLTDCKARVNAVAFSPDGS